MASKRMTKIVQGMVNDLDSKGIHNYSGRFENYGSLMDYYRRNYKDDIQFAEIFAYVVLKHEITPYSSSVRMPNQDKKMQKCHRIMLDMVVGTRYERYIDDNSEYSKYKKNLGILYGQYFKKNRQRGVSYLIMNKDFFNTPFPLAFIKICNDVYGSSLGI